jgi:hypothetical protein
MILTTIRSFAAAAVLFPVLGLDAHDPQPQAQALRAAAPAQQTPAADPFVLAAGPLKLTDLVARAADYLGCNILIDPREAQQIADAAITLQREVKTDRAGCEEFLAAALSEAGMVVGYVDGTQQTMAATMRNGAYADRMLVRAVPRTPAEVLARPGLAMPATVIVGLQHCGNRVAFEALRPFATTGRSPREGIVVQDLGESNRLMLVGLQRDLAFALGVLAKVDTPEAASAKQHADEQRALDDRLRRLEQQVREKQPGKDGGK